MNTLLLVIMFVACASFFGIAGFYVGCRGASLYYSKKLAKINGQMLFHVSRHQAPDQPSQPEA